MTDCPGLVFPSLLPKPLQILAGMFNIAQVNEPYSVVQYLAERVPLPELLDLVHPALLPEWQDDTPVGPTKVRARAPRLQRRTGPGSAPPPTADRTGAASQHGRAADQRGSAATPAPAVDRMGHL